ncbi:hypothetical protein VA599_23705 [Chromobacterium sp. TRC.1.1.SA]|uniref:Uncharacterized protein n=1 Tax=Chromobacterium indicum TaxID=3110228 RepID=A0ABV0CRG0_9NEIS
MRSATLSILNPPPEVTPLKFKGWLQTEAAKINAHYPPGHVIRIRLFLTPRLMYCLPRKKMDALMQGIVNRNDKIFGIELYETDHSLTADEMMEEAQLAQQDLPGA